MHPLTTHFALRQRTSALVRVYHNLDGDLQSFQSLIVTPSMTARDLLQVAVARAAPRESPEGFSLVLKTPTSAGGNAPCDGGDVYERKLNIITGYFWQYSYCSPRS